MNCIPSIFCPGSDSTALPKISPISHSCSLSPRSEESNMMSNNHPGASRKRKMREDYDAQASNKSEPANRLLAGYMAHEFLTQGTLLGRKWDQRANSLQVGSTDQTKSNLLAQTESELVSQHAYANVSNLLKTDGVHIPGVVNPTQLARWLQM